MRASSAKRDAGRGVFLSMVNLGDSFSGILTVHGEGRCICAGEIHVFHQPEIRLGGYSPHKPPFGVWSCEVTQIFAGGLPLPLLSCSLARHASEVFSDGP